MKTTYKAGALFCGGCNSRYDRLRFYQDLCARYESEGRGGRRDGDGGVSFDYYEAGMPCDFIVLINGCGSECLLENDYPCPVVLMKNGDLDDAVCRVDECLEKLAQTAGKGNLE